jgi:hypothetical protein
MQEAQIQTETKTNIEQQINQNFLLTLTLNTNTNTDTNTVTINNLNLATNQVKKISSISKNFENLQRNLYSYRNILFDNIFEKIGYEYKGKIQEPNFLHLSTQSFLIGIYQEIDKEIKDNNLEKITYCDLINLISQAIVKENFFVEAMEIQIGKFKSLRPFVKEDKIFRSMLIDLNSTKNEILKNEEILKNQNLTEKDFKKILEKIFKISLNVFLNNINSDEDEKKNYLLYENFENLQEKNKENFDLDIFLTQYALMKNINLNKNDKKSDKNLINQLEGYYRFCLCSFDDIINEIEQFNENANSLIFKISSILEKFEYFEIFKNFKNLESLRNFVGLKNFKNFSILENSYGESLLALKKFSNFSNENFSLKNFSYENFNFLKEFLLQNNYIDINSNFRNLREKFDFDFDFKFNFDFKFLFDFSAINALNKRYQNFLNFMESLYNSIKLKSDKTYLEIETKSSKLKKWINSIECVKSTKEKTYENFNKTKILYEKISNKFHDSMNFNLNFYKEKFLVKLNSLCIKENSEKFLFSIKDSSLEKIKYFKEIIINFLSLYAKKLNESFNYLKLNEGKPLFKISTDKDNYFSIEINKNFLPENFLILANMFKKLLNEFFTFEYVQYFFNNNNITKELKSIKSVEENMDQKNEIVSNKNDNDNKTKIN